MVAEVLGTNRFFTGGTAPIGVHVVLRLTPPKALAAFEPERVLVGHGEGIVGPDATDGLREALRTSRRGLPASSSAYRSPAAARRPGRTSRGGATSPASFTGGFSGSASGAASNDARTRSSGASP